MGDKRQKNNDKYEDITSYSKPKGITKGLSHFMRYKFKPFFLRNHKRNLKALLSIVICLVLVFSALGGAYIRKILSLINYETGESGDPNATFAIDEDENLSFQSIADIANADSIKDLIKSWALNGGEKLYSKNVVNVLLIGEDNEEGSHRSDSCMLVSVNRKTKKINICSFLRDSYSYMNIKGQDRFDKTNHSYSWGGAAKLMEVLSDNYKIQIDYYVSINFESFVKVIDTLGGVSVPITEAEAKYMNRTTRIAGFESGDNVLLNGERALIYARIRKNDSEIERTRRQRCLITSLIKNVKSSSFSDLNKAIETFLPYVTTNYRTNQIISLGTQALSEGWMQYEINSMVEPSDEYRMGVHHFQTYTGKLDVWIVDYIKAARELQLAIFGTTNIEINPATHISALDLARNTSAEIYDDASGQQRSTTASTDWSYDESTTKKRSRLDGILGRNDDETTTRRRYYYLPGDDETTAEQPYDEPTAEPVTEPQQHDTPTEAPPAEQSATAGYTGLFGR